MKAERLGLRLCKNGFQGTHWAPTKGFPKQTFSRYAIAMVYLSFKSASFPGNDLHIYMPVIHSYSLIFLTMF